MVRLDAAGNGLDRVNVEAGVGLIQQGQRGLEHEQLQNLSLLLLTAGEADVQIAVRVGRVHVQGLHLGGHLAAELHDLDGLAGHSTGSRAQKALQRDAGDLLRRLEGQEHTRAGAHVGGLVGDVLPAEDDLTAGDGVAGIAHQGAHQGGLAGTVVTHQYVGLTGVHRQVQSVEKDLIFLTDDDL